MDTITFVDGTILAILPRPRWWQLRRWWAYLRAEKITVTSSAGARTVRALTPPQTPIAPTPGEG